MRQTVKRAALGAALLAAAGALLNRMAVRRWDARTEALKAQLLPRASSGTTGASGGTLDVTAAETATALPDPVRRYLSAAISTGTGRVQAARVESAGTFRLLSPTDTRGPDDGWMSFRAAQTVAVDPPGLLWVARMRLAPFVTIDVRDGYVQGRGSTEASLLHLVPVASAYGTPELNAGALLRWLAEAVWVPTALLPGTHLHWSPIDDLHARVTVRDGDTEASAEFEFNSHGDVVGVAAERDMGTANGYVRAPWRGRFWRHEARGGMRIPLEGEVAWYLNGELRPYWRGRVVGASYE